MAIYHYQNKIGSLEKEGTFEAENDSCALNILQCKEEICILYKFEGNSETAIILWEDTEEFEKIIEDALNQLEKLSWESKEKKEKVILAKEI